MDGRLETVYKQIKLMLINATDFIYFWLKTISCNLIQVRFGLLCLALYEIKFQIVVCIAFLELMQISHSDR